MPEGHSLVLAARRIRPVLGQRVTSGPLAGTDVASIETRGKHLLVHGADGRSLHVRMRDGSVSSYRIGDHGSLTSVGSAFVTTAFGVAGLVAD